MSEPGPPGPAPEPPRSAPRRPGLAGAASSADFSLSGAVGGARGVVEASLPTLAFLVVYTVTQDLRAAVVVALVISALALAARALARTSVGPALAGAAGVAISAVVAARTGRAEDFYLPGLLTNAVYALVLAASTVRWPRVGLVPVVGLVVGLLRDGPSWRADPARLRLYRRLTWVIAAVFLLRLAVEVPLYLAGAVVALGVVKLVMGLPLYGAAIWVCWSVLRRLPPLGPQPDPGVDPEPDPQPGGTAAPTGTAQPTGTTQPTGTARPGGSTG